MVYFIKHYYLYFSFINYYSFIKYVMNMASSCKTTLHFRFIQTTSLYYILYSTIIVVALNFERLYNKTFDLGLDYKMGC